ncbi:MAG: restriction endonuclease subunit S [Crocinitomicaceae bacterium]|nr:restriction endonuclease subunit S [Crocinitomicaceae bacterium]
MMTATKDNKSFYNNEIPEGWVMKELFSLGNVSSGGTPDTTNEIFWNGNVNWCTPTDITKLNGSKYIGETVVKISAAGLKNSSARLLPINSVIVCTRATIGKAAISVEEISTNQGFKNIIPNEKKVNVEFLYYSIINSENKLLRLGNGSTFLEVPKSDFEKFKIPLPPLPEQKAIAKVLCAADAAIHTTEKLIAKKVLRKKWLMQQLLTGKKRLKGFGGEWKEVPLSEMFSERNETKYFDLPLLSIGQNGVYPQDESIKKDTSNDDKSKYKRICQGDIGYNTMRMWQGRSALSGLEGIVSPAYTVVTPKKNADSLFFSYLFKMPKMTNLFWRNSQGLVDDTLNCKYKDFSIVRVVLPQTKEEQTAIAQVLQAADKEIRLLKAKAVKLREQKKGLMQVLLTGKVRLKIN